MVYDAKIDCLVSVVDWLPYHIKGLVTETGDGQYMMFINSRLSERERKRTYRHEQGHILRGDLHSELPVKILEEIESA